MDFVNKAYAQAADLFRSMSPGARIASGLLLAVIIVSLVYLFQFQVTTGDEFLLGGRPFSASEISQIEAAFAAESLGGSTFVGNRIRIPRGQKSAYLAAMALHGALPADFFKYLDDAIASDNPFASNKLLELKQSTAKMKELALMISRMRGVETATVQYDEEARGGLGRTKQKTAMVAVWTSGSTLEEEQVKAIRNVVASAYAGLDRQSITITDMTSHQTFGGSIGPGGVAEGENLYANYKLQYERNWQRKIAEQLAMIPGVIVGVNVEMDPQMQHTSQSVKLDPKPITLSSKESSRESATQVPNQAGRPGAVPNGVGNQAIAVSAQASPTNESTTSESRSDVQNLPGHETSISQLVPLAPKKVTAAVDIPSSYFVKVWREKNPSPAGGTTAPPAADLAKIETETIAKVKESVRNLLPPFVEGTDPYPHITVSTYTDLPSQPAAEPALASQVTLWLADNWRTMGMIVLGLFSLLMLRSMLRSSAGSPAPAPLVAAGEAGPRLAATPDDEDAEEPMQVLRKRFDASGPDLKRELHELVKENPDAAANVLRMWIGDAA
jgi:flagellar M-ring protein FliF